MNNKFGIKNFRVFDDKGAQFKLAPITVLTGCNSSGKSSMIKAIMLFEDFLKDFTRDFAKKEMRHIASFPLELNQGMHKLARFDESLNHNSTSDEMAFSWSKHSLFANKEIDIEFVFKENKENVLGNGMLNKISVICEGRMLYIADFDKLEKEAAITINHHALKNMFFEFVDKISDNGVFTLNLNPHNSNSVSDFEKSSELVNILSKISRDNEPSQYNLAYQYIKNDASKDDLEELVSFLTAITKIDSKNKTLFYTPAYEYLKDATKENIKELIFDKIEVPENGDKLLKYLLDRLENVVNSFINSKYIYFKEFFDEMEDSFLSEKYSKEENLKFITQDRKSFFLDTTINILTLSHRGRDSAFNLAFSQDDNSFFEELCMIMYEFSAFIDNEFYENNIVVYEEMGFNGESQFVNCEEHMLLKEHFAWISFVDLFLRDTIFNRPDSLNNVEFINSNRPKVERFYDISNQSGGFAHLLKDYVSSSKKDIPLKGGTKYKLGDFLRKWVKEFEIADDVIFKTTEQGSGILIYLKNKGESPTLLADLGYGITQVLSMLLKIELSIVNKFELDKSSNILNLRKSYDDCVSHKQTICIEEPEANLHPKFQSKLADMFMEANELYNINFILETHSEYLIRKFQNLVASPIHKATAEDISIYYLYNPNAVPKGKKQVELLEIRPDGILKQDFGEGFFDEASNLTFELLKLQNPN